MTSLKQQCVISGRYFLDPNYASVYLLSFLKLDNYVSLYKLWSNIVKKMSKNFLDEDENEQ
jgi:hypothetical protein